MNVFWGPGTKCVCVCVYVCVCVCVCEQLFRAGTINNVV